MTTDEITEALRVASLTNLLAVDAARATLANLPADDPRRLVLKLELSNAYGRMGLARGSYGKFVTEPRSYTTHETFAPEDRSEQYEAALERVAAEMGDVS